MTTLSELGGCEDEFYCFHFDDGATALKVARSWNADHRLRRLVQRVQEVPDEIRRSRSGDGSEEAQSALVQKRVYVLFEGKPHKMFVSNASAV